MSVVLEQLVQPASVFMVAALLLGAVFDRVPPGRLRELATGLVCGAAAAVLIATSPAALGFGDGRGPLVLVATFIGGPLGLLGALPAPLAVILVDGGPDAVAACGNVVVLALAGLGAYFARERLGLSFRRTSILWLAVLPPLAFTSAALAPDTVDPLVDPLSFWLPLGTMLFGFAVITEQSRGEAKRWERTEARFRALTDTVSPALFRSQLEQHFRMHLRYGHEYSYMLVSIDDAAALRKSLPASEWELVRAAVAAHVRRSVRDLDLCAAVDFDRFGVILPHASLPFALPVAERVQKAVAAAMADLGRDLTVSVGVAEVDGTTQPTDVEKGAEGELFLANMRQPRAAIGPLLQLAAPAQPERSFPGGDTAPPAGVERRVRPPRLVPLGEAPAEEDIVFAPCAA